MLVLVLLLVGINLANAFTPLNPTNGNVYTVEAVRASAWPSCAYRFLSFSASCDKVDLWNGAGANQHWTFIDTGDGDGSFYLKSSCGYLSYPSDCSNTATIDLWSQAGINQKFRFVKGNNVGFDYYIEAVGRASCAYRYMSFPGGCTTSGADKVDFWSATGENQRFRLYPVDAASPATHKSATSFVCPDPFVWQSRNTSADNGIHITCTGGGLHLGYAKGWNEVFSFQGDALGGNPAAWAAISYPDSRWAPENYETPDGRANFLFFSDTQESDGKHRIGYVASSKGPTPGTYDVYSSSYLNLGMAAGGDIDGSIFEDPTNGRTYLVWKTDDNSVGSTETRIWLQELSFISQTLHVDLVGAPQVILTSPGLWWVDSWVNGGSLIEGPELIRHANGYYYLFFAAGKFCQDTYTEGVARSRNLWGPYEKLGSPLLSNGVVGKAYDAQGKLQQIVGPGHASIVPLQSGEYKLVWHGSIGENCDRYSFASDLGWTSDAWPYVKL